MDIMIQKARSQAEHLVSKEKEKAQKHPPKNTWWNGHQQYNNSNDNSVNDNTGNYNKQYYRDSWSYYNKNSLYLTECPHRISARGTKKSMAKSTRLISVSVRVKRNPPVFGVRTRVNFRVSMCSTEHGTQPSQLVPTPISLTGWSVQSVIFPLDR